MLACATLRKESRIVYIAPNYQQARDIAWERLKKVAEPAKPTVNESRLEITFTNGSIILLRGWESIENLRGQQFDLMVVDEVAVLKGWLRVWNEVLQPTLAYRRGSALFISTPKGNNHFKALYDTNDPDYESFHFTSYDNPHLPREEIERSKRQLPPDAFAQEYLAEFRSMYGLVCQWWDRSINVQERDDVFTWYETLDGGFQDPAAYLLVGQDAKGNLHIQDGFREQFLTAETIAQERERVRKLRTIAGAFIDSDDPRLTHELAEQEMYFTPVKKLRHESKSWDEVLAQSLYEHRGITVDPKLDWLIQEIETLAWKETKDETLPLWDMHRQYGHHYDGIRALAYLTISLDQGEAGVVQTNVHEPERAPLSYDIRRAIETMYRPRNVFSRGKHTSRFYTPGRGPRLL